MDEWALTLNERVIKCFSIKEGQSLTIGRGSEADIVIDNNAISRQHSCLELKGGVYYLADLYSLNGTKVNGEKIESSVPIAKTDQIEIGKFTLRPFDADNEAASGSYSATPAVNDETVFVSSKSATPVGQGRVPRNNAQYLLTVIGGQASPKELILDGKTSVKIGKDPSCDIVMAGFLIARTQCYIIKKENKYFLIPHSSWIKNRINGVKITDEKELRKGDLIEISSVKIRYE